MNKTATTTDRHNHDDIQSNKGKATMLIEHINLNNRIKTLVTGFAAAAITGTIAMTGSAQASFQAFDASVEDPSSVVTVQVNESVVAQQLPADPHDAGIVMGWITTAVEPANDKTQTGSLVSVIGGSFHGDDHDVVVENRPEQVTVFTDPLPGDPHDEGIVMGRISTVIEPGKALVLGRSYQGDENEEPAPPIALAYFGDESDQPPFGPITVAIAGSYQGDENDDREPVRPLAFFGDESDQPDAVVIVLLEETWTATV